MFENYPILSLITFIPLAGAFLLIFMTRVSNADAQEQLSKNAPRVALVISSAVFFLALMLTFDFDSSKSGFQFVETTKWLGGGINFRLGVDGISILFVLLTTFLTPLCILASERSVKSRMLEFMVAFLILETLMIGTFVALDLILFYLFFEAVLIPMFIIIGVWGGKNRVYASYKFFLYTLLGSVLMLAAIMWIYSFSMVNLGDATTNIEVLINELRIPKETQ
jgi:NADH-quinone oxidoreductase subunit M